MTEVIVVGLIVYGIVLCVINIRAFLKQRKIDSAPPPPPRVVSSEYSLEDMIILVIGSGKYDARNIYNRIQREFPNHSRIGTIDVATVEEMANLMTLTSTLLFVDPAYRLYKLSTTGHARYKRIESGR